MTILTDAPLYVVNTAGVTISTAITVSQIKAGAAVPLVLVRARLWQVGGTASQQARISILRKTAAATVTAFTPLKFNANSPTAAAVGSTSGTGITGTAEGTNGDILVDTAFNVLSGFEWVPTPMEQIFVPASGIIAMTFLTAPSSQTWYSQLVFAECQ